jgi:hypothetical protein
VSGEAKGRGGAGGGRGVATGDTKRGRSVTKRDQPPVQRKDALAGAQGSRRITSQRSAHHNGGAQRSAAEARSAACRNA